MWSFFENRFLEKTFLGCSKFPFAEFIYVLFNAVI
jgi:hypothetical protein